MTNNTAPVNFDYTASEKAMLIAQIEAAIQQLKAGKEVPIFYLIQMFTAKLNEIADSLKQGWGTYADKITHTQDAATRFHDDVLQVEKLRGETPPVDIPQSLIDKMKTDYNDYKIALTDLNTYIKDHKVSQDWIDTAKEVNDNFDMIAQTGDVDVHQQWHDFDTLISGGSDYNSELTAALTKWGDAYAAAKTAGTPSDDDVLTKWTDGGPSAEGLDAINTKLQAVSSDANNELNQKGQIINTDQGCAQKGIQAFSDMLSTMVRNFISS